MLVACRLAGLSRLEAHYAGSAWARNKPMRQGRSVYQRPTRPMRFLSLLLWGQRCCAGDSVAAYARIVSRPILLGDEEAISEFLEVARRGPGTGATGARPVAGHPKMRERLDRGRCGCYMFQRIQRGRFCPANQP